MGGNGISAVCRHMLGKYRLLPPKSIPPKNGRPPTVKKKRRIALRSRRKTTTAICRKYRLPPNKVVTAEKQETIYRQNQYGQTANTAPPNMCWPKKTTPIEDHSRIELLYNRSREYHSKETRKDISSALSNRPWLL